MQTPTRAGRRSCDGDAKRTRLLEQITGCWRTQALHAAVQLDLPDRLADGPIDASALAQVCGCATDALRRLLRALCTLEVCIERSDGRFELAEAGALLRRSAADDRQPGLRAMALWWGDSMWSMWGDLAYSVRTGASVRARQTGRAHYGFLDDRAEVATVFHDAMRAMTALIATDVAALDTWRDAQELVDVGGGYGELTAAILASCPLLRATVLDRQDAEIGARAVFERRHLAGRARFVAGDFFESVPPGRDRYLLKSILHNWNDAACRRLLANCADAAPRGARLVIVERIRPRRLRSTRHDQALARTDLNMLAGLGGRERTLDEFAALLEPAGFCIVTVAQTRNEFSVIEAERRWCPDVHA